MKVHDSQAYRKIDVTRERVSRILELREILLSDFDACGPIACWILAWTFLVGNMVLV